MNSRRSPSLFQFALQTIRSCFFFQHESLAFRAGTKIGRCLFRSPSLFQFRVRDSILIMCVFVYFIYIFQHESFSSAYRDITSSVHFTRLALWLSFPDQFGVVARTQYAPCLRFVLPDFLTSFALFFFFFPVVF